MLKFLNWKVYAGVGICIMLIFALNALDLNPIRRSVKKLVLNPYEKVNWSSFEHHKAALHVHTIQSDGSHTVDEVVRTYRDAGFTVLAITDHDWNYPKVTWDPDLKAPSYPKDPKPANYPANPTWPWTDYGGPDPEELGMVGIQANELTFRHHINSYFSNYGIWYERTGRAAPYGGIVDEEGNEIWEDDQLNDIKDKGGLGIINHPSTLDEYGWWERKPLEWYVERFRNHSADYLLGIEVTNVEAGTVDKMQELIKYDLGLWDQLLARFMPERPVWGFGVDDMHVFYATPAWNWKPVDAYTVFIIDELTEAAVRDAMVNGQFYFVKSTRLINIQEDDMSVFPVIERIEVNEDAGTITIAASDYDQIKWISAPESLETLEDYKTSNQPWSLGRVVHEGETLDINSSPHIKNFVRAELIRTEGEITYRTFTNPFGIGN